MRRRRKRPRDGSPMKSSDSKLTDPRTTPSLKAPLRRLSLIPRPRSLRKLTRLSEEVPTTGNDWKLYFESPEVFDDLLADLDRARERIHIEMYIFSDGEIGKRVGEALVRANQRGVKTRVLYDCVGSFRTRRSFFAELRSAGVDVAEYHPVAPWRQRFAIFARNHRKTVVIDGRIAYSGGVNIGDKWYERDFSGRGWRDTHMRIEGPASGDLEVLFFDSWQRQTGQLLEYSHDRQRRANNSPWQFLVFGRHGTPHNSARGLFRTGLRKARKRIRITASYFVPDRGLRRELLRARERGVEIELLLPSRSDVRVVDWASRASFSRYMKAGIRVFLWQPTILHAKSMAIDDDLGAVGTSNLDRWSLNYNLEADLLSNDPDLVRALNQQFDTDLESSRELSLRDWQRRPWTHKAIERLASLFSPWL